MFDAHDGRLKDNRQPEPVGCGKDRMVFVRIIDLEHGVLEANACGVPVVGVAEGGVRETIIDGVNGLLVDDDTNAMGAAIEQLLADSLGPRRLGMAARSLVVERWSLRAAVDRLEAKLAHTISDSAVCDHGAPTMHPSSPRRGLV